MFRKELYNGIPNVTMWRVLRKFLHLKAYKRLTTVFSTSRGYNSHIYSCNLFGFLRSLTRAGAELVTNALCKVLVTGLNG
jgi:hypothetical protein